MISAMPARPQLRHAPEPAVPPASPRAETPTAARLRRSTAHLYLAAVATIPVTVFWGPAVGDDRVFLTFLLCGGVIAVAGLMLLIFAVVRRTARDAAVVLAALLALAGAVSLAPLAGTAGREAALDRNAAALEALVPELRAEPPEVLTILTGKQSEWAPEVTDQQRGTVERLRAQLRTLGFNSALVEPGYVVFTGWVPFAPDLLYVTGASVPRMVENCARPDLRFAGGRWYTYRCPTAGGD